MVYPSQRCIIQIFPIFDRCHCPTISFSRKSPCKPTLKLPPLHFASYQVPGALYAAPGRVNLIGEHTDYSDGFVMPAAIDFATVVAISHAQTAGVLIHSVNYEERVDKSVAELLDDGFAALRGGRDVHWSDYPAGVLWALREHGVPVENGFSMTIAAMFLWGPGSAPLPRSRSPPHSPSSAPPASTCNRPRSPCFASAPRMPSSARTAASWTSSSAASASRTTPS